VEIMEKLHMKPVKAQKKENDLDDFLFSFLIKKINESRKFKIGTRSLMLTES